MKLENIFNCYKKTACILILCIVLSFQLTTVADHALTNTIVDVTSFGAIGDGVANDANAILQAIEAAKGIPNSVLVLPHARGYASDRTIHIPAGISLEQHAPLIYIGNGYEPLLIIGEEGKTTRGTYKGINVTRKQISPWLKEDSQMESIGLQMINVHTSTVDIVEASRFTIGIQLIGAGGGVAYNRFEIGMVSDNYIGMDLTNKSVNGKAGWVNENLFLNGRFTAWSTTNIDKSRIGVRITSLDGTYQNNNNNVFIKPCFELMSKTALPILIEHGKYNTFEYIRNEGNSDKTATILNESCYNFMSAGYGRVILDDKSLFPTNIGQDQYSHLYANYSNAIAIYNLVDLYQNKHGVVSFPGLTIANYDKADVVDEVSEVYLEKDGKDIILKGRYALGVTLDTSKVKSFLIKRAVNEKGNGARIIIRGYNTQGGIVSEADKWLKAAPGNQPYWHEGFGGSYISGSDNNYPLFFAVEQDIKKVWVGIAAGTNPAKIQGFSLFTQQGESGSVLR